MANIVSEIRRNHCWRCCAWRW